MSALLLLLAEVISFDVHYVSIASFTVKTFKERLKKAKYSMCKCWFKLERIKRILVLCIVEETIEEKK